MKKTDTPKEITFPTKPKFAIGEEVLVRDREGYSLNLTLCKVKSYEIDKTNLSYIVKSRGWRNSTFSSADVVALDDPNLAEKIVAWLKVKPKYPRVIRRKQRLVAQIKRKAAKSLKRKTEVMTLKNPKK